ncbi:MAG: hypothetical protein WCI17_01805 [bacterium]
MNHRARVVHLLLAFTILRLFAAPVRADEASSCFLWEQANARMATARTAEEFLEAARTYNQLVSAGVRNGPLLFNLGTALLLAGDGENAVAALRRAERHLGSTPELRVNLRQALALQSDQPDADLPWDHVVFFWHYDEPVRVRALIALCGWMLLWLSLLLRLLARPAGTAGATRVLSFAKPGIFFGLLLLIVFSCSTAFSLLQEQMDDRSWSERTLACKTSPERTP